MNYSSLDNRGLHWPQNKDQLDSLWHSLDRLLTELSSDLMLRPACMVAGLLSSYLGKMLYRAAVKNTLTSKDNCAKVVGR